MNVNSISHTGVFHIHFFLAILFCIITRSPISAQVKKIDGQTAIPAISQEVYKSITQFYEYDRNIPLNPRVVSEEDYEGANKQKIIFQGINNSQVPALLVMPKDGHLNHPVILIADGLGGEKNWWVDDKSFSLGGLVTKSLIKNGFAVNL